MDFAKQITNVGFNRYATEASTLGIRPGAMPVEISAGAFGNGRPFVLVRVDAQEAGVYRQDAGLIDLIVFND